MATFTAQTGTTITDAFNKFHSENPKVYELFKQQIFRGIRLGKSRISSKQLLGFIRWEIFLQTQTDLFTSVDGEDRNFKINDAFTSRYVRLFITDYPQYEHLFEVRKLRTL